MTNSSEYIKPGQHLSSDTDSLDSTTYKSHDTTGAEDLESI
jgi:hypothetical protein